MAVLALFFSGWRAADEHFVSAAALGIIGVVFLIASGDFVWRRGFVAGKRATSDRT